MKHTPSHKRFAAHEPDPGSAVALRDDHPALSEGRTIFPTTVVASMESPRFLVSGHNSPKIGKAVTKGPRAGWPIFTLTLEERATCPRSCEQWASCYGNAMPFARRHAVDAGFLPLLRAEVATLCRANPEGLLIRLHVLGDFYSVEYVLAWAELLAQFPQLHVFGYTARTVIDGGESAKIARAIDLLTSNMWERFAIRTSSEIATTAYSRAIVVDEPPADENVIVCPAQTGASESCGTCGLCWAGAARGKTIAFLRHGMTRARRSASALTPHVHAPFKRQSASNAARFGPSREPAAIAARQAEEDARLLGAVERLADATGAATASLAALAEASQIAKGSVLFVVRRLAEAGRLTVIRNGVQGQTRVPNSYRIPVQGHADAPLPPPPAPPELSDHQKAALDVLSERAVGGVVTIDIGAMRKIAGQSYSTFQLCVDALRRKGFTERMPKERGGDPERYRVIRPSRPERGLAVKPAPETPQEPRPAFVVMTPPPTPQPAPRPACAAPAPVPAAEPIRAPALDEPVMGAAPHSLLALGYRKCRWPTNAPAPGMGHLTTFCCAGTAEGETYCAEHAKAARGVQGRTRSDQQRIEAAARARARAATRHATRKAEAQL